MTKESILDEHVKYAWECDQASPVIPYSEAERAMDEWAKHQGIEFFKWYALRMASFIDYFIKRADPAFRSEEIEQSVKEHEGATIEQLYQQFIDNQFIEQQNKDNG